MNGSGKQASKEILVGLLLFAGIGLLILFTLVFSDLPFLSGGQTITVTFDRVLGLREGDSVFVSGVRVGRVTSIELLPDQPRVNVKLRLSQPVKLFSNCRITTTESSLLGGRAIEIERGDPELGVADLSRPLVGDAQQGAAKGITRILDENRENVLQITTNLADILARIRNGEGSLGKAITDPSLYESFLAFVDNANRVVAGVERGEGTLGLLIKDRTLYDNVNGFVTRAQEIVTEIREGRGLAGRLVSDEALANDFSSLVADARSVARKADSGEGTIGKLVNDPSAYDELKGAAAGINTLVAGINEGRGTLGKLATDDTLYVDLRAIGGDIRSLVADVRAGRGTIGKLMTDDEMYAKLSQAAAAITGAIEDAREAAPVTTFTTALFAIF